MKTPVTQWLLVCVTALLLVQTPAWGQARGLPADDQVVLTVRDSVSSRTTVKRFDLRTLENLPQHTFTTMTPWSDQPIRFSGPLLRTVLAAVGTHGHNIRATAINDYRIDIPMQDTIRFDMIVATRMNGERMSVRDKGPLFVVYPFDSLSELQQARYYERSIWQLKSIEIE